MKKRGVITLVFDDGYQAVYDEVVPLLARHKVRAVFAIPLKPLNNKIEDEILAPSDQWLQAATKYGHEIAAHSVSHTDLTTVMDAELVTELEQPSKVLSAATVVYPGGAHNECVVASAKEFYSAGRTVVHGLETLPPQDPMRLKTINFTKKNFSVLRANIHAFRAYAGNRWLIETYHMVKSAHSPLFHSTDLADLDKHLSFITSLPVKIATIQDIISDTVV